MKRWIELASVCLALFTPLAPAAAQDFPSRPISIITTYSAGGPYDILARFMGESLRKHKLSQPVIVEAKPGGNTLVGIQYVKNAPADGHTLLVSTLPLTANLILMKSPGYKLEDFVPVGPLARHPYILFVPSSLPVNNLKELIAYGEKNAGKLNIGVLSPGGQVTILSDRLIRASQMKVEKIPYKGAADLATALLTGDIQMSFFAYSAGAPFMKDGKIKPIAVSTEQRFPIMPYVPTFKELGLNVSGEAWVGLFARANTPKPALDKLIAMIAEASGDADYIAKVREAGNDKWDITADRMSAYISADFKNWEPDLKLVEPQ